MQDVTRVKCFEEVARVIGHGSAMIELQKVVQSGLKVDEHGSLWSAFTWNETPQGANFWLNIVSGDLPTGYTNSDEQGVTLKPFYVNIKGFTRRVKVITLMNLLKDKVSSIEFEDPEEEWHWEDYANFGVVEKDGQYHAQFWNSPRNFGLEAVELTFDEAVNMLDGTPVDEPVEGSEEEPKPIPAFYVSIGNMGRNERRIFIEELQEACDGKVDHIEYLDEDSSWHCWGYVGLTEDSELEFWDTEYPYGDEAVQLSPAQALELVGSGGVSDSVASKPNSNFPDFNFTVVNGSDPLVREWLRENGMVWNSGDSLTSWGLSFESLEVNVGDGTVLVGDSLDYPRINVDVEEVKYIQANWEIVDTEKAARQERIKELEEELERLKSVA